MKTKFGKTIAGVALLFCAYGAGGCHGDLDIMQDNKLSASNMWIFSVIIALPYCPILPPFFFRSQNHSAARCWACGLTI